MIKRISVLIFLFLFSISFGWTEENNNHCFIESLERMQKQVGKWKKQLEEMQDNPNLPLIKKDIIKPLHRLLEEIDRFLDEYLPPKPKLKETGFINYRKKDQPFISY
jgi:hypothetical protein